jgi:hypothetical protein
MSSKFVSCIFVLFLSINCIHGQTIKYSYDENGNRTSRFLIDVERLGAKGINFPVKKPEELQVKDKEKEFKVAKEGELSVSVYPNPNRGKIKIDILNMPLNSGTELRLYDLNGTELIVKMNFEKSSELDISRFTDGIYILRVEINNIVNNWKIIKNTY